MDLKVKKDQEEMMERKDQQDPVDIKENLALMENLEIAVLKANMSINNQLMELILIDNTR